MVSLHEDANNEYDLGLPFERNLNIIGVTWGK